MAEKMEKQEEQEKQDQSVHRDSMASVDHESVSEVSELEELDLRSLYSNNVVFEEENVKTTANLTEEGRVNVNISQKHNFLTKTLLPRLCPKSGVTAPTPDLTDASTLPAWATGGEEPPPPLNIVIQIVGSRGDVQPFIALGKDLQEKYGHRVRLATHATFRQFVTENGLEFFNIGGDPASLMEYMVKNPGLLPGKESLKAGDVGKRKKEIEQMMNGCWRSCIEAGDGMDDEEYDPTDPKYRPFVASAIIANPPGFAHIHCAEKLGIPIHLMFTMPWTPTQSFPHPLANLNATDTDPRVANFLSYPMVMMLMFQGTGNIMNRFREEVLKLDPISVFWTPILASKSKLPFTYCWSPALVPKPSDWSANVHVAGFFFLPLASSYTPDPALAAFLDAGPPPVYIGFGSIVVNDPNGMTTMILEAVKKAGVRALVSKGWGGFGADSLDVPENVFFLGNCPHDWLFKRVAAVVHHGGAGTTAAGIAAGVPTLVVPFFGDQPFWGAMVNRAGAGPPPIPHKLLTAEKLANAIKFCLLEETQEAAKHMGEQIRNEDGPQQGSYHFHAELPVDRLRCALDHDSAAVWRLRHTDTRIGALAAAVLCNEGLIKVEDLKLNRVREYDLSEQPFDPVSGAISTTLGTLSNIMMNTMNLPRDMMRAAKSNTMPAKQNGTGISRASTDLSPQTAKSLSSKGSGQQGHHENTVRDVIGVVRKDWFTVVNLPREVTQSVAKGFHNAPRLYGDTTVRTPDKVTSLRTGLKAGGKQFGFGMYDAVTGLVTQPYHGAKQEGAKGFFKGAGKGIGGLLLKPEAAVLGGIGYAWEGFYRHARKGHQAGWDERHGVVPIDEQLSASRLQEGYFAFHESSEERRAGIIRRWNELQTFWTTRDKAAKEKAAGCPSEWISQHTHRRHPSFPTSGTNSETSSTIGVIQPSSPDSASIISENNKPVESEKGMVSSPLSREPTLTDESHPAPQPVSEDNASPPSHADDDIEVLENPPPSFTEATANDKIATQIKEKALSSTEISS